MKRAIIYTRVSTEEQRRSGYSLPDQELKIRNWCHSRNIEVVRHFQDDSSAKTFDRKDFQLMYEFCRQDKTIDGLLVVLWDRFSRADIDESAGMIKKFQKIGVEVQAIEQPIAWDIPEQKYLLVIYLISGNVDNIRRGMRIKSGMRSAQSEGRWMGGAPYGYRRSRDEHNKPIIVPNERADIVRKVFEQYASGTYTMEEIRRECQAHGFNYAKKDLAYFFKNKAYVGLVRVAPFNNEPEKFIKGLHEAIVDEQTFESVQAIMKGKNRTVLSHKADDALPLRRFLICPACGKNLTGSASRSRSERYYYYHCTYPCRIRYRASEVNDSFVEYLRELKLPDEIGEYAETILQDIFKSEFGDRKSALERNQKDLRELEAACLKTDQKFMNNELSAESYERLCSHYKARKEELIDQSRQVQHIDKDFRKHFEFGLHLTKHLDEFYVAANLEAKQILISSTFPDKVIYSEKKCRTFKLNPMLALMHRKNNDLQWNKNANEENFRENPPRVETRGVEPLTSRLPALRSPN
jgi:site-specific DNA recombinase